MGWKQLLFDWDRTDRDAAVLDRHLCLAGLPDADRRLIVAALRHGDWVRVADADGDRAHSVWRASQRDMGRMAGLSPGAVCKAKNRLVARDVARYEPGALVVSWSRVWALEPLPDPAAQHADFDATDGSASARFRAPQEQEDISISSNTQLPTQPNGAPSPSTGAHDPAGPVAVGALVGRDALADAAAANRMRDHHIATVTDRIMGAVGDVERRHGTPASHRLARGMAERIAAAVIEDEHPADEIRSVLGSMGRREGFTTSPAAFFVGCAKRRGWLQLQGE